MLSRCHRTLMLGNTRSVKEINVHLCFPRSSHPGVFLGKGILKICSQFIGNLNHTSALVFSCKSTAYFQNTFLQEHLWWAASVFASKKCLSFYWFFLLLNCFFFYLGFLSRIFTIHGTAGEGGAYLFNSSLPLPHASKTLRH